jgi:protoporphyrinogen oxidase
MARESSAVVLGGGIAGCTLAAELARSGRVSVTLFERAPHLGGLHRSELVSGLVYDIGAFIFGDDHSIFAMFPELRKAFRHVPNRYGSVRAGGVLDEYPMSLGGVRRQLGTLGLSRIALEILAAKITRRRPDSVRSFSEYYMGPTLYRFSGLKTYIERLYLAPDTEIDLEFATKRMAAVVDSAGLRRNAVRLARELGRGRLKGPRPMTAEHVWVRPPEGFGAVYRSIRACLETLGVVVRCATAPSRIAAEHGRFAFQTPDGDETFDHVFSTIPLEAAARLLGVTAFEVPEYVDLYSMFFTHEGELRFPHNVLHNFTESGRWKRLTVFSRYYGTVEGRHYFAVEGTAREHAGDEPTLAAGEEDFRSFAREHALFPGTLRLTGGVLTRKAYPVYRRESARGVEALRQELRRRGLHLAGRQGTFDYVTSSDAAGDAAAVAQSFLAGLR